jgi:hypothetical protein
VGDTIVGIQGHPEFDVAYSSALMESRRGHLIAEDTVDAGLASLVQDTESSRLAEWILDFAKAKKV